MITNNYITQSATLGVGSISLKVLDEISLSLFNVPLTVVGMAAAGALLGFAYADESDEKMTRGQVYKLALANTVFTVCAVAVLPGWLGWSWYNEDIQGAFSLLLAASARFIIRVLIKLPAEIVRKYLGLGMQRITGDKNGDDNAK